MFYHWLKLALSLQLPLLKSWDTKLWPTKWSILKLFEQQAAVLISNIEDNTSVCLDMEFLFERQFKLISHDTNEVDIKDITWLRGDMNFIFEYSTRYLTSERSEWVRCRVEHKKIKFISTSGHVIFCLLYENTYNDVFDDFKNISQDFPKVFQRKGELFRTFS